MLNVFCLITGKELRILHLFTSFYGMYEFFIVVEITLIKNIKFISKRINDGLSIFFLIEGFLA